MPFSFFIAHAYHDFYIHSDLEHIEHWFIDIIINLTRKRSMELNLQLTKRYVKHDSAIKKFNLNRKECFFIDVKSALLNSTNYIKWTKCKRVKSIFNIQCANSDVYLCTQNIIVKMIWNLNISFWSGLRCFISGSIRLFWELTIRFKIITFILIDNSVLELDFILDL